MENTAVEKTALVVIDIQNDYFSGGRFPLPEAAVAAAVAARVLRMFREGKRPIVHIQHEAANPELGFFLPGSEGMAIQTLAAPQLGEPLVIKHRANAFHETGLEKELQTIGAENLVVCGMMSNNCVDATVRVAMDKGYGCTVVHDACAAAALALEEEKVSARLVHVAFMGALGLAGARVVSFAMLQAAMESK